MLTLNTSAFLPDDFLQVPKIPLSEEDEFFLPIPGNSDYIPLPEEFWLPQSPDHDTLKREWDEIGVDLRLTILREPPSPTPSKCFVCGGETSDRDGLICMDCWDEAGRDAYLDSREDAEDQAYAE